MIPYKMRRTIIIIDSNIETDTHTHTHVYLPAPEAINLFFNRIYILNPTREYGIAVPY